MNLALHGAVTPGQGASGFDGLIVVTPPFRNPLQGPEGTLRRPGQPRVQLVRLALAPEPRQVLSSGAGGSHLRRLRLPLGELGGLVLILPLWSPPHQPGRPTGGELAGRRLCHHQPCLPRRSVLPGLALRLAQTRRIAGYGRVAPSIPTRLELPAEAPGVPVPRVPALQERGVIGREATAATVRAALALR
jgi:hypothetical protein